MGHGESEIPKVPNPDIFKVEDSPRLMDVQRILAERGLKNPWLRNEVWRYREVPWRRSDEIRWNLTKGLRVGIPLIILTLAIEKYFNIEYGHHPNKNARDYY